jgi:thioredoxin reductase (NADPH)
MSNFPSETLEQHALRFPKLTDAQIAHLRTLSKARLANPREILFNQETAAPSIFVVLIGNVEIVGVSNGVESILSVLGPAEFTGEVSQLSGRRSLVLCRACEMSELLEIDRASLRQIMQTDALLGDVFLRAFLLRRIFLVANSIGDAVLIGSFGTQDFLFFHRHATEFSSVLTALPAARWLPGMVRALWFRRAAGKRNRQDGLRRQYRGPSPRATKGER